MISRHVIYCDHYPDGAGEAGSNARERKPATVSHEIRGEIRTESPQTHQRSSENRNLRMTLNKLPGICENLTTKDENWTNWGFLELVKVLESWTRRNPKTVDVDLGTRRNEKPVFKSQ